ncbi:hypothetical protein COX95_01265 [bacterium CG_4_10_14_0_2_um_filter_33_32]|nr:MAG: hypothetical protein AUJ93_00840 [bacterium CG2_30_33_46]PIR67262.1 MAG: hypothetical protein COU50_04275 [bacterium CG10_big_fil_rev_8_21_14_0_10_33_18]PIU76603.1 MAG: hypothetical protein COS74_03280 [bacterium CG06_land_8_20_14_3_00_33_50]PIW81738.1 MAG: hypothetical protein COZ97_00305 [bacterium CG_4_8_14_3_um_filter_33_28]PIY85103.1 MAG: hypothetical protein COY76_04020 [bacterium CG_4_10_14_0_8_um_filter_33_57]PIZ86433.1 MAG: hypothetical protein COX95_01265 [bacterium CG_4_10_1
MDGFLTPKLINKKQIGFTLIEMLAVISIISILAAFAIPALYSWYSPIKLRGVQRDLISDLRLTQQKTVTSQKNHLIRFNTSNNSYQLIKKDGGEEIIKTTFLYSGIDYSSISLSPLPLEIEFNSAAVPNSTGEIILINGRGEIKKIEISASGFVKGD